MKKILVAMMVLASLATVSKAADTKYEVGVLPGYSIPVAGDYWGNSTTGVKSSFALAAYGDYKYNDMLMFGLDLGYDFGHKLQGDNPENYRAAILQITPHAKYYKNMNILGKNGKVYGVFGLGLYDLKSKYDTGTTVPNANGDSMACFGINVGGGADIEIAPNWLVGAEVRWHHIFNAIAMADDNGNITNYAANNITPTLKVAYTF